MALTAAQLQSQLDDLQTAINAGVLLVQHGTDRVQYQSLRDMRRALASLKAQLDALNGVAPRSRVNYIRQESKGFGPPGGAFVGKDFSES